jgi:chromosome segregation ATPase
MESILRDMDLITDMAMNDVLAAEQRVREEEVQKWSARLDVLETSVNNQAAALIKHAEARAADAEARAADAEARAADAEARAADAEARAADAEARAADAEARAADAEEARAADAEEARAADAEEARAAESRAADADEQPGTTTELIEVRIWCMCLQESFRNRECVLSSHLTRVWVCPR